MADINRKNHQGVKNKPNKQGLSEKPFAPNTGDTYPEKGNNQGSTKVDDMRAPMDVESGDEKTDEEQNEEENIERVEDSAHRP